MEGYGMTEADASALEAGLDKSQLKRNIIILLLIVLAGAGFAFFVPVFPLTYEESYQVEVPYDEQVEYTVEVPYTVQESYYVQIPYSTVEDMESTLMIYEDFTLDDWCFWWPSIYIPRGRDIIFSVSASNTVDLCIMTSEQGSNFEETKSRTPNEKELNDISNGNLGYHVSLSDDYCFLIFNPHWGWWSKENVGIYSASITAYWQEEVTRYRTETKYQDVTKYRTETRYRTVEKYRTETHYRDVTIKVTLIEFLSNQANEGETS